jgi:hypothetical protein
MTAFGWATAHLRFPEPVLASEKCVAVSVLVPQHAFRFAFSTLMGFGDIASADRLAPDRIGVTAAWVEKFPLSVLANLDAIVAAVVSSQISLLALVALWLSAIDIGWQKGAGTVGAGKFRVKTGPHPGPVKRSALKDFFFLTTTGHPAGSEAYVELSTILEHVVRHSGAKRHCGEAREGDGDIE